MRAGTRLSMLLCFCPLLTLAQTADLGVTKLGPGGASAGANVTYTLSLINAGPDSAAAVSLNDPLPAGMTFVSLAQGSGPAFTCSTPSVGAGGTVTCTIANLTSGSSANFSLVVKIDAAAAGGTIFTNIATASTDTFDPNDENNSGAAATVVAGNLADLAISKDGPQSAPPGGNVTYVLTVFNGGPNAATNVAVDDPLPGTMTFVSLSSPAGYVCTTPAVGSTGTVHCTIASLPSGSSGTFTLIGKIPAGTPSGTDFVNTATVSSPTNDPLPDNNVATLTTTVGAVDVSITKTGPASATPGSNVTYTITVANAGPDAADTVAINDSLPPGVTFVSLAQNNGDPFTCFTPSVGANGTVSCTDLSLFPSGSSAQFTLVGKFDQAINATTVSNTATVSTASADTNPNNNSATATTTLAGADVSVVVSASNTVPPAANLTYTITVTNNGPATANSVTLTDPLPAGTTFVSRSQSGTPFTCTAPAVGANGTLSCSVATLSPGASAVFTLVVAVSGASGTTLTNTAAVVSSTTDPVLGNNSSSSQTTIGLILPPVSAPTLSGWGLLLLAAALLIQAFLVGRNRGKLRQWLR